MARKKCCRRISPSIEGRQFLPEGIFPSGEIVLSFDELEAVRLADLLGLYQEESAAKMGVSRQTFGRIIEAAHAKIADALINGKALKIEGGTVSVAASHPSCCGCEHKRGKRCGRSGTMECPACPKKEQQGVYA